MVLYSWHRSRGRSWSSGSCCQSWTCLSRRAKPGISCSSNFLWQQDAVTQTLIRNRALTQLHRTCLRLSDGLFKMCSGSSVQSCSIPWSKGNAAEAPEISQHVQRAAYTNVTRRKAGRLLFPVQTAGAFHALVHGDARSCQVKVEAEKRRGHLPATQIRSQCDAISPRAGACPRRHKAFMTRAIYGLVSLPQS